MENLNKMKLKIGFYQAGKEFKKKKIISP